MQEAQETKEAKATKKRIPLANVALLLIVTSLIGQVLGFLRTKLINANLPLTGPNSTDSYFAAFNIPDLFFYTLAAGVLGVAFIPILADRLQKNDRKGMWEVSSSLLNLLTIIMAVVGIIMFIYAKPLIHHIVAPKLTGEGLDNAVFIMRCLCLNPMLFTISGILSAVQQTIGRFFFYAIAPLFYNLAIIASLYVMPCNASRAHGECAVGSMGVKALGIGALAGAVLQLLVIVVGLIGTRFSWKPKIVWRSGDFKSVVKALPARSIDQGMDQIQTITETHLANNLGQGVISNYNNAAVLQAAPTLLIGTAISTAAFPRLAERLSQGRPDLFRRDFLRVLRYMIWITLPVVIVAYFARGYLARMIFTKGSREIALIFGFLVVAIFFRTLYTIISRWFYAQKDTKTPLFVSIFTIGLNLVLAITLSRRSAYGAVGLALSVSIAAMAEVIVLGIIMVIRDRGLLNMAFWGGVGRIISVSGFSMVAGYLAISTFPLGADDRGAITLGSKLVLITFVTFAAHVTVSGLFGLDEARPIFVWLKRVILRPIRGAY